MKKTSKKKVHHTKTTVNHKKTHVVHHKHHCCSSKKCMKIALTCGYFVSLWILFLSLLALYLGMGQPIVHLIASIYLGYTLTFKGIVIGILWGFLDGFIGGYVFMLILSHVHKCCGKGKCKSHCDK